MGLRIAMIAPPWYEVPPLGYGGIESLLGALVLALCRAGHELYLVASGAAHTPARFLQTYAEPPTNPVANSHAEVAHAAVASRRLSEYPVDVIHDHSIAGPLLAIGKRAPTLVTTHLAIDRDLHLYYSELAREVALVAISDAQRQQAPTLPWAATVHNGIDVSRFPFRKAKNDFVLFLGRFGREKGAHIAIDAAREAGVQIVLAGKCENAEERDYFASEVEPRLGSGVEYVGPADFDTKCKLLSLARCLVFPIVWNEPFGMVMLEAMACGTPVVALERGSVPEVVRHGETGYVCGSVNELSQAIRDAPAIDGRGCREHVEQNFSIDATAAKYVSLYENLV